MARARNIKPGIITNDELASTSPFARLVFIYSWMLADFNGNLEYKPVKLKVQTLPYDDVDIDGLVTELERFGFVKRYDENGSRYMHICNFKKHQNPHKNESSRGSETPTPESVKSRKKLKEKTEQDQQTKDDSVKDQIKTEPVPSQNGTAPADSLSLIPDSGSLIPDTSELPCAPKAAPPEESIPDIATQAIAYLNEKAGRNFKVVPASTKLIQARLKEGATLDDIKDVIDRKCAEWAGNPKFEQYLRPATLFNAEKFNNYVGQIGAPLPVSNLVDGTSRFAGRQTVDERNREVALQWAAGGDFYDQQ